MTQNETGRQVQSGFRLVENEHVGIVQQRGGNQHLLLHPLGVPAHRLVGGARHAEEIEERADLVSQQRFRDSTQASDQFEMLAAGQEAVEVRLLRHVADPGLVLDETVGDVRRR